ncbi:MAG: hypothetical protein HY301_01120, partial [Verrucomicrobia bacterium]|nr:hypothetical protein [Verrucomicrobiota bacterium]
MKSKLRRNLVSIALLLATLILQPATAFGQGSAFTYQGFLTLNGTPANAANDFIFALFNASSGGAQAGSTVQTNGVGVTNGLFTVALDFGSAPFDGTALWLQIATRPAGAAAFTNVVPRQPIAATPYATFAGGVNAAGISNGSITASKLATGAAASNLQASGQSIVPSGGVILASNSSDASLVGAGYQSFGKVEIGVGWQQKSSAPLAGRYSATAVWTGNEMIVWGGFGGTAA